MKRFVINFAAKPFINTKILTYILLVLFLLILLSTVYNVLFFYYNGKEYIISLKKLKNQNVEKVQLNNKLKEAEKILSDKNVILLKREALYLKEILDKKEFSFLKFLERLEKIKPYRSLFQSITPKLMKDGNFLVKVKGVANPREEIFKLEENIFKSDYFGKPHLIYEELEKTTQWQAFEINFIYYPRGKK